MTTIQRWSFRVLLAFAFSIPLEDSVKFGVGRISKVLGLLALAGWLLAVASSGKFRRPVAAMYVATGFVGWSFVSFFWSSAQTATFTKVGTLVQLLAVVYLVWDQVASQRDLVILIRAFLLGAFAASALTMLAAATGRATEGARFASSNAGPNNTGALLAVAVALTFLLLRADENRRYKPLYIAFLPVFSTALILTASRTAAISLALGLVIIAFDRRVLTLRRVTRLVPIAVIAIVLAVLFVPAKSFDRLGTTSSEISSGTLNGRTLYWKLCFNLFYHHPLQGIGSGAFPQTNLLLGDRGIVAHNAFLSILAELGAVGISLFLGAIFLAARGLLPLRQDLRRAWLAAGVTWGIGASALTWEVRKITWFLLAIALVQARVAYETRRVEAPAREAAVLA
jgi:O-antigen ligase